MNSDGRIHYGKLVIFTIFEMKYDDLKNCTLCEHRCEVNRLVSETGVCRMTLPEVASATLHPAPPESFTVFMAGCNFKCLNCQNWTIGFAGRPLNYKFL